MSGEDNPDHNNPNRGCREVGGITRKRDLHPPYTNTQTHTPSISLT